MRRIEHAALQPSVTRCFHQTRVFLATILKTRLFVRALTWLVLCNQQCIALDSEEIARAIREANCDHEASIKSLSVEYEADTSVFETTDFKLPEAPLIWIKSGQSELIRTGLPSPESDDNVKLWCAWNGKHAHQLHYFRFDRNLVSTVHVCDQLPHQIKQLAVPALALGWRLRGLRLRSLDGLSLSQLLTSAPASAITSESVRVFTGPNNESVEFPAYKWVVKRFAPHTQGGPEHTLTVWFDPENEWLPRQLLFYPDLPANQGPMAPPRADPFQVSVAEFIDVFDPLAQRNRRFPSVIYTYGMEEARFDVRKVRINEPIEPGTFEPEMTAGAKIIHDEGTRRQKTTYSGGSDGQRLHADYEKRDSEYRRTVPASADSPSITPALANVSTSTPLVSVPTTTPVNAAPSTVRPINLGYVSALIGAVCLGCTVWLRFRRR